MSEHTFPYRDPADKRNRWLLVKGRREESLNTLARLHARGNINDAFVQGEFLAMNESLEAEAGIKQSWGVVSTSLHSYTTTSDPSS